MCGITDVYECVFVEIDKEYFYKHKNIMMGVIYQPPGGRLNKKDGLTRYGDSHVKDKTS